MRKLLAVVTLFVTVTLGFAQGRIIFENDSLHLVYMTTDTDRLLPADVSVAGQPVPASGQLPSGHTLLVDLWGGTSSDELTKLASTTFSLTPGIFGPANVILPAGYPTTTPSFFQVQVYDQMATSYAVAAGSTQLYYGESAIFTVIPNPGPTLYNSIVGSSSTWAQGLIPVPGGMGSFAVQMNPVPEPSALALLGLAGALGLAWRRKS